MPGMWYLLSLLLVAICAAQTTDGGRGELPGMRKDIFDQMKDAKNKGPPSKCRRMPKVRAHPPLLMAWVSQKGYMAME